MGTEGFLKVEEANGKDGEDEERKDVNGGEVDLEENGSDGREAVVSEEKEEFNLGWDAEGGDDGNSDWVAEEKDCIEGAEAKGEENRAAEGAEVSEETGEVGVGLEEERGIDEDKDPGLGLGCLNVNVESVEGMGDRDCSLEKEE